MEQASKTRYIFGRLGGNLRFVLPDATYMKSLKHDHLIYYLHLNTTRTNHKSSDLKTET